MEETAKKTEAFLSAIQALSERECKAIDEETESVRKARLEALEAESKKHYKSYVEYEVARIRAQANREISQKSEASRKALTALRQEICDSVFQKARKELLAFRETPEYKEMLLHSAKAAAGEFPQGGAEIFICAADARFGEEIRSAFGLPCTVTVSEDIALGGLRVLSKDAGCLADDTLDKRLASQKTWFLENSGLSIEE